LRTEEFVLFPCVRLAYSTPWINPLIRKDDELLGKLDTDIRDFIADVNRFNRNW